MIFIAISSKAAPPTGQSVSEPFGRFSDNFFGLGKI